MVLAPLTHLFAPILRQMLEAPAYVAFPPIILDLGTANVAIFLSFCPLFLQNLATL